MCLETASLGPSDWLACVETRELQEREWDIQVYTETVQFEELPSIQIDGASNQSIEEHWSKHHPYNEYSNYFKATEIEKSMFWHEFIDIGIKRVSLIQNNIFLRAVHIKHTLKKA